MKKKRPCKNSKNNFYFTPGTIHLRGILQLNGTESSFDEDVFSQKVVEYTAKSEEKDVAQRFVKSLEKDI